MRGQIFQQTAKQSRDEECGFSGADFYHTHMPCKTQSRRGHVPSLPTMLSEARRAERSLLFEIGKKCLFDL